MKRIYGMPKKAHRYCCERGNWKEYKSPLLCLLFFHPDYTVGFGISPNPAFARGLYRRSGVSPCPEEVLCFYDTIIHHWL